MWIVYQSVVESCLNAVFLSCSRRADCLVKLELAELKSVSTVNNCEQRFFEAVGLEDCFG